MDAGFTLADTPAPGAPVARDDGATSDIFSERQSERAMPWM